MKNSTKTWISTGLTLTIIAAAIWLFTGWHGGMNYGYGYGYMPYGMMMGGSGAGVVMILFWVIVVVALALAVSGILGGQSDNRSDVACGCGSEALEILKQRYARGDIEHEEYELKKRELRD